MLPTLRPATIDDAPALAKMQGEAAGGWSVASYENELTLAWSRMVILENTAGVMLGAMVYWVVADEIQLLNIAVDPAHRRQGLGRILMDALLQRAKEGGQVRITLEVRRDNLAAQALYRGLDFTSVGVRPKYYADTGADAILMERDV